MIAQILKIEGGIGQPGQPGQGSPLALILDRFAGPAAPCLGVESADVAPTPAASAAPSHNPTPDAWDAARAATVLGECDRLIDSARPSLTPVQRNVVDWSLRGLGRHLADKHDPLLWETPDFLREQLSRWGRGDGANSP